MSVAGACDTFVCHAAVGPIPGAAVIGIVSCFYLALVVITLMGYYASVGMTLPFYDVPPGATGLER